MLVNSLPRRAEDDLSNVFVQSGLGRDSYLYGIGFSRVSSSRLPVNDDTAQLVTIEQKDIENSTSANIVNAIRIIAFHWA